MSHLKSLKKITSKIEDYKLKKEKKEKKKFEIHSFFLVRNITWKVNK